MPPTQTHLGRLNARLVPQALSQLLQEIASVRAVHLVHSVALGQDIVFVLLVQSARLAQTAGPSLARLAGSVRTLTLPVLRFAKGVPQALSVIQ